VNEAGRKSDISRFLKRKSASASSFKRVKKNMLRVGEKYWISPRGAAYELYKIHSDVAEYFINDQKVLGNRKPVKGRDAALLLLINGWIRINVDSDMLLMHFKNRPNTESLARSVVSVNDYTYVSVDHFMFDDKANTPTNWKGMRGDFIKFGLKGRSRFGTYDESGTIVDEMVERSEDPFMHMDLSGRQPSWDRTDFEIEDFFNAAIEMFDKIAPGRVVVCEDRWNENGYIRLYDYVSTAPYLRITQMFEENGIWALVEDTIFQSWIMAKLEDYGFEHTGTKVMKRPLFLEHPIESEERSPVMGTLREQIIAKIEEIVESSESMDVLQHDPNHFVKEAEKEVEEEEVDDEEKKKLEAEEKHVADLFAQLMKEA